MRLSALLPLEMLYYRNATTTLGRYLVYLQPKLIIEFGCCSQLYTLGKTNSRSSRFFFFTIITKIARSS